MEQKLPDHQKYKGLNDCQYNTDTGRYTEPVPTVVNHNPRLDGAIFSLLTRNILKGRPIKSLSKAELQTIPHIYFRIHQWYVNENASTKHSIWPPEARHYFEHINMLCTQQGYHTMTFIQKEENNEED